MGPDDVIRSFRAHHQFLDDCLDAHLIAAALEHFGMASRSGQPTSNLFDPSFQQSSDEQQYTWIKKQAGLILEKVLSKPENTTCQSSGVVSAVHALDEERAQLDAMRQHDRTFKCSVAGCSKVYKRLGNFKNHLRRVHNMLSPAVPDLPAGSSDGCVKTVVGTFVKMALLARDTYDAYRHCDGDRVFGNAKLEFLYAASCGHTKYRLWLWRMLAFEMVLLSPREAHEYKWNVAVNLQGGSGNNIPNDNYVELQVNSIKKQLLAQGANKSYDSAVLACKTVQIVDKICDQLQKSSGSARSSRKRPQVDKTKDIDLMVEYILRSGLFHESETKQWESFDDFKEPFDNLDINKMHAWMLEHKDILATMFQ